MLWMCSMTEESVFNRKNRKKSHGFGREQKEYVKSWPWVKGDLKLCKCSTYIGKSQKCKWQSRHKHSHL